MDLAAKAKALRQETSLLYDNRHCPEVCKKGTLTPESAYRFTEEWGTTEGATLLEGETTSRISVRRKC